MVLARTTQGPSPNPCCKQAAAIMIVCRQQPQQSVAELVSVPLQFTNLRNPPVPLVGYEDSNIGYARQVIHT